MMTAFLLVVAGVLQLAALIFAAATGQNMEKKDLASARYTLAFTVLEATLASGLFYLAGAL
jgi:hypothetical protein